MQVAINWYDEKQDGLGKQFYQSVKDSFAKIKLNPFFGIRYDKVRCLKIRRFPYLIHYIADEGKQTVTVVGVLHTSLNPDVYWKNNKDF